ncbi:MAG: glycosyltransferase family 39 protein [Cyanobacteria bacterium P01_A01_bin.37]
MTNQSLLENQAQRPRKSEEAIAPQPQQRMLKTISFVLIGVVIMLRKLQFSTGRSLWGDEAKIALNIVNRSYLDLTQVLDYNQVAPIGFLWVEKLSTQIFGATDFALRVFPLVSAIAALFLVYHLAKRYLNPVAVPVAIALFAFLSRQIYYSSEIKQYSSDAMIALLLVSVVYSTSTALTRRQVITFSVVGAIAVWMSHPSIFVLASIALTQIVGQIIRTMRDHKPLHLGSWFITYSIWATSFLAFYVLSLGENSGNDTLLTSWANRRAFPATFPDLDWMFYSLKRFFRKPLDFPEPFFNMVAIAAYIAGMVSLCKRKADGVLPLFLPIMLTLAAAYLYKYPFYSRVVTFLVPFFVLMMAEGVSWLVNAKSRPGFTKTATSFVGFVFIGLLLYVPASQARAYLTPPVTDEEVKPVLAYIQEHWQPNDLIYVFQKSQFQFEFYREQFGFQPEDYVVSVDPDQYVETNFAKVRQLYRKDLRQLCGRDRVWVMISDFKIRPQTRFMLDHVDTLGDRRDTFQSNTPASVTYLYDLRECSGK